MSDFAGINEIAAKAYVAHYRVLNGVRPGLFAAWDKLPDRVQKAWRVAVVTILADAETQNDTTLMSYDERTELLEDDK